MELTGVQYQQLIQLFRRLDLDNDGRITPAEFKRSRLLNTHIIPRVILSMF